MHAYLYIWCRIADIDVIASAVGVIDAFCQAALSQPPWTVYSIFLSTDVDRVRFIQKASHWRESALRHVVGMVQEPADPSDEIYQHPNVIATPHTGVASTEVLEQLVAVVCQNIIRQREGGELLHRLC